MVTVNGKWILPNSHYNGVLGLLRSKALHRLLAVEWFPTHGFGEKYNNVL